MVSVISPRSRGTKLLVEKAKKTGVAVLATRNHGHFGAAGIYARIPLEHDLLTFVTSGHQLSLKPGAPIFGAAGGSPMAFNAPGADGSPIVVDFGCMHDLYPSDPNRDEIARLAPGLVLRSIGMGEICQVWGGFLSGLRLDPDPPRWQWPGANQGAMVFTFRIDLFVDPDDFKQRVDDLVERVGTLKPFAPFERSFAAGVVESVREEDCRENGIPISREHAGQFEELAALLGIEPL